MSTDSPKFSAVERVLAYAAATIIAVAVVSYITTLIVSLVAGREALASGMWQVVTWVSFYGVPIGFVLMMVLLGITFTRRGRANRSAGQKQAGKAGSRPKKRE